MRSWGGLIGNGLKNIHYLCVCYTQVIVQGFIRNQSKHQILLRDFIDF